MSLILAVSTTSWLRDVSENADIDAGKYGRMWIKYIREEYPMRYKSLVRFGELEERADEVNDTAYELLDDRCV